MCVTSVGGSSIVLNDGAGIALKMLIFSKAPWVRPHLNLLTHLIDCLLKLGAIESCMLRGFTFLPIYGSKAATQEDHTSLHHIVS